MSHIIDVFLLRLGHLDAVKALIEHGADVNAEDKDKGTPLHHSVLRGKSFSQLHPIFLSFFIYSHYLSRSLGRSSGSH